MSRRPPLSALVLLAITVVAAASWWRPGSPSHTSDQAPSPSPAASAAGSSPPRGLPSPAHAATELLPPIETTDDGLDTLDLWAAIGDPANPDLPPDLFTQLTQLGVDVVIADTTRVGRQRWPHYWARQAPTARADVCCSHIAIHVAGASTDPNNPEVVQVTVVWSAQAANRQLHQVSTVHLVPRDNIWHPLPRN